MTAIKGLLYK